MNPSAYPVTSGQRSTVEEIRCRYAGPLDQATSHDIADLLQVVDAQRAELARHRDGLAAIEREAGR